MTILNISTWVSPGGLEGSTFTSARRIASYMSALTRLVWPGTSTFLTVMRSTLVLGDLPGVGAFFTALLIAVHSSFNVALPKHETSVHCARRGGAGAANDYVGYRVCVTRWSVTKALAELRSPSRPVLGSGSDGSTVLGAT